MAQKVLAHEQHFQEAKRFKKVNYVYRYASDSDDDQDTEIGLAEWSKFKKTMMCQWVKDTSKEEKYDFDINKADKIFDLLLQEKQIQLPVGHILPSAEELKKRKYCKWRVLITPTNARCSDNKSNRPLNKEELSLMMERSR